MLTVKYVIMLEQTWLSISIWWLSMTIWTWCHLLSIQVVSITNKLIRKYLLTIFTITVKQISRNKLHPASNQLMPGWNTFWCVAKIRGLHSTVHSTDAIPEENSNNSIIWIISRQNQNKTTIIVVLVLLLLLLVVSIWHQCQTARSIVWFKEIYICPTRSGQLPGPIDISGHTVAVWCLIIQLQL